MTTSLAVSDQYKSFILAGLHPLEIADICGRALSFWSYQVSQEIAFQHAAVKAGEHQAQAIEARTATTIAELRERLK
ncbi:hypothetical protein GGI23_001511, partial [Coemansia sp. RSA 2559]